MGRLVAYLDETGHASGGTPVGVAGLVAGPAAFHALDLEWREALARAGVARFHAREFAHSVGPFAAWGDDEPRRQRFLAGLVRAIGCARPAAVAAFAAPGPAGAGEPYRDCLAAAFRASLAQAGPGPGPVDLVVARTSEYRGVAEELWTRLRRDPATRGTTGVLRLGDALEVPGLQAADLLAYELAKELGRRRSGLPGPPRWPLRALASILAGGLPATGA